MKLTHVKIEAYRSIKQRMEFVVEPSVTVILGPNDHGKTNLLCALSHLNEDEPFEEDDLNWDCEDAASRPELTATFTLDENERQWLVEKENIHRRMLNAKYFPNVSPGDPIPTSDDDNTELDDEDVGDDEDELEIPDDERSDAPKSPLPYIEIASVPFNFLVSRTGVKSDLKVLSHELLSTETIVEFRKEFYPRIEIFDPITKLSDSVSAKELADGKNDFMRGIFHYAGIDPDHCQDLFTQNDKTTKQLKMASRVLNETLKQSWTQGTNLHFELAHNSKDAAIELRIEDPSVTNRFVRASRRSSGFTHYFSLKTNLYARQKDFPAHAYILLFDEPGVFLHPSGQYDLVQVLETLSRDNQVLYVTHSLFMVSKNFPTRHRLLMKDDSGTRLDGKPYVGRWQAALSSLGMSLTGTILFANHVILTEGDSDPIYIYAVIQRAIQAGKCHLDINSMVALSTSESKNADVLIRILTESVPKPLIGMIADGDKGGKDRIACLKHLLVMNSIPVNHLDPGTEIEDHLPMIKEAYVPAVAAYTAKLMEANGKTLPDSAAFEQRFLDSFGKQFAETDKLMGVATWAKQAAKEIGEIEREPSKVGIAREYCLRIADMPDEKFKLGKRAEALIRWIQKEMKVRDIAPSANRILE